MVCVRNVGTPWYTFGVGHRCYCHMADTRLSGFGAVKPRLPGPQKSFFGSRRAAVILSNGRHAIELIEPTDSTI